MAVRRRVFLILMSMFFPLMSSASGSQEACRLTVFEFLLPVSHIASAYTHYTSASGSPFSSTLGSACSKRSTLGSVRCATKPHMSAITDKALLFSVGGQSLFFLWVASPEGGVALGHVHRVRHTEADLRIFSQFWQA